MKIVIFSHPAFLRSQSMPRFADMLGAAYRMKGHDVDVWSPKPYLNKLFKSARFAKWAGYVDQYAIFPWRVRRLLKETSPETLFVFCDQALGPWVPLVKHRPHIVHVHDLLALRAGLGEIPEKKLSITGRIYQRFIRQGFRQAKHFISVSQKTRSDLHKYGQVEAETSEVVYNGLNYPFSRMPPDQAQQILQAAGLPYSPDGILLHVGGGQWYKNLLGVIHIYARYAAEQRQPLPLWCVGPEPNKQILAAISRISEKGAVVFFPGVETQVLQAMYSHARALLFPSLAEGFGWPLVEAQACGCPVVTTGEPPMNEVAGDSAIYLPRLSKRSDIYSWATHAARELDKLLAESEILRAARTQMGFDWISRFDPEKAIDKYLSIYRSVHESAITKAGSSQELNRAKKT